MLGIQPYSVTPHPSWHSRFHSCPFSVSDSASRAGRRDGWDFYSWGGILAVRACHERKAGAGMEALHVSCLAMWALRV